MKTDEDVMERLRSQPPAVVSHDLAPEILSRIKAAQEPRTAGWRLVFPLAAAASLALLLGGLWLTRVRPADPTRRALAWLCRTQEPDGSWSAAKWGGDRQFEVALTSLSLIALLESAGSSPRRERAVERAIAYLIRNQDASGTFGEDFSSSPYNQGIATLALAKAYETRKNETLRLAVDRAVAAVCASQSADGGWGYRQGASLASNLSITLWQIEALRLAAAQGWTQARANGERGFRWMAGMAAEDGFFGYQRSGDTPGSAAQTLTAMGAMSLLDPAHMSLVSPGRRQAIRVQMQRLASTPSPDMDYYRRYFLAAALKRMGEESAQRKLATIRRDLLARQVKRGAEAGSWTADDQWGSAGGRIYATAMASLSLR